VSNPRGQYSYEFARPAVTVDIVLISREPQPHVLLIRRGNEPFKGAWALPGGFVDPDETLTEAAQRELREETGVTGVELEELGAFGDPGRDPRGWTVSIVFLARVDRAAINTKASDDAAEVEWRLLARPPKNLAFDHEKILERARERLQAAEP
jgi:8-oxo-dGTP diphosphatase